MQITLTNVQMVNSIQGLSSLRKMNLPTTISWRFNKNFKRITNSLEDYYKEENDLVNKYAEKDENGQMIITNGRYQVKENIKEFSEKISELYKLEDSIDILTINLSDLEKYEISGEILDSISFMINEDSEEIEN